MTQTVPTIVTSESGTQLTTDLNNTFESFLSSHRGSDRPSYAIAGTVWIKTISSTLEEVYLYDGAVDILLYTYNPTASTRSLGDATADSVNVSGATPPDNGIYLPAADSLGFTTNGVEHMRIGSTGNLGIGVSPTYFVHAFQAASGPHFVLENAYADTSCTGLYFIKNRGSVSGALNTVAANDLLGKIYFHGADGTNASTPGAAVGAIVDGSVSAGAVPTALQFFTAPAGTLTERMRITSAGYVGIATTAPTTILDILSSGDTAARLYGNSYVAWAIQSFRASASDHAILNLYGARGTSASPAAVADGDLIASIYPRGYDGAAYQVLGSIRFAVGGTVSSGVVPGKFYIATANASGAVTDRLYINAAGNVYVGITAQGDTLQYLDVLNVHSGNSAGAIVRLVTNNAANSGTTVVDMVKYRTGTFNITNNEPSASSCINMRAGGTGGVTLSMGATSWAATSDIRLKKKVSPIESTLESLMAFDAISYHLENDAEDSPLRFGFSAQDVQKAFPEVVRRMVDEMGTLCLSTTEMIPLYHTAIKELYERVRVLEKLAAK